MQNFVLNDRKRRMNDRPLELGRAVVAECSDAAGDDIAL